MKIALVISPAFFKRCPPVGIAYLYSYLWLKGHEPCVFDLNIMMEVPYEGREDYWGDILFAKNSRLISLIYLNL